jgi:hypothetical protein
MWYLSGDDTPRMISHYVSAVLKYVNSETGKFDGAYGPRLRRFSGYFDQIDAVRRRLTLDRDTRRAVVTLFDPTVDNNEASANIPCQVLHQLFIRNDKLEMVTYARSQDMFKGFVYDTAEWQLFQDIVAGWLHLGLGQYRLYMASAHIYEDDLPKVSNIIKRDMDFDLYREVMPLPAASSFEESERIRKLFSEVESMTRVSQSQGKSVYERALRSIDSVDHRFWRDAMIALVSYNAHKAGETDYATSLASSITNEFRILLFAWFSRRKLRKR